MYDLRDEQEAKAFYDWNHRWDALARFNSRTDLPHTSKYIELMRQQQEAFNLEKNAAVTSPDAPRPLTEPLRLGNLVGQAMAAAQNLHGPERATEFQRLFRLAARSASPDPDFRLFGLTKEQIKRAIDIADLWQPDWRKPS